MGILNTVITKTFSDNGGIDSFRKLFEGISYTPLPLGDNNIWASAKNPQEGFSAYEESCGNKVRFFSNPNQLGNFGRKLKTYWPKGAVGLALYWNEKLQTGGGTFVTTTYKNAWHPSIRPTIYPSYVRSIPFLWKASGKTIYSDGLDSNTPFSLLKHTLIHSVAQTEEARLIDHSLDGDSHLGGSYSFVFKAPILNERAAIRNYAYLQKVLGINVTSPGPGFGENQQDIAQSEAPLNFSGNEVSGIHSPAYSYNTLIKSIVAVMRKEGHLKDTPPIFVHGIDQTGFKIANYFLNQGFEVTASHSHLTPFVVRLLDRNKRNLRFVLDLSQRQNNFSPNLYEEELGIYNIEFLKSYAKRQGWEIKYGNSLVDCLELAPETKYLIPCSTSKPLQAEVRAYLRTSQIKYVIGSSRFIHQNSAIKNQPYLESVWDMQREGIFVSHPLEINRGETTASLANMLGLGEVGLKAQQTQIVESTLEELKLFTQSPLFRFEQPPEITITNQARRLSNQDIKLGAAKGALLNEIPRIPPYETNFRCQSLGHYNGAALMGMGSYILFDSLMLQRDLPGSFLENIFSSVYSIGGFMGMESVLKGMLSLIFPEIPILTYMAPLLSSALMALGPELYEKGQDIDKASLLNILYNVVTSGILFTLGNHGVTSITRSLLAPLGISGALNVGLSSFSGLAVGQLLEKIENKGLQYIEDSRRV